MIDVKLGGKIKVNNVTLMCVKSDNCKECYFHKHRKIYCDVYKCYSKCREDNTNIIFKLVE